MTYSFRCDWISERVRKTVRFWWLNMLKGDNNFQKSLYVTSMDKKSQITAFVAIHDVHVAEAQQC